MPARPSRGATIGRALAMVALTALAALLRQAPLCAAEGPERGAEEPRPAEAGGAAAPGLAATFWGDLRGAGRTLWRTVRVEAPPRRRGQWIYLVALAGASAALEAHKEEIRRDVLRSSFYRHSPGRTSPARRGWGSTRKASPPCSTAAASSRARRRCGRPGSSWANRSWWRRQGPPS